MAVERIAAELAVDIATYVCGTGNRPVNNLYSFTMRRNVEEMLAKHEYLFNGMVNELDVTTDNVASTFRNVVEDMFDDGSVSWGRIVAVYAFAGRLAKHLVMAEDGATAEIIAQVSEICGSVVVAQERKDWIERQGGWDSFNTFYEDSRDGCLVWLGLLLTASLFVGAAVL